MAIAAMTFMPFTAFGSSLAAARVRMFLQTAVKLSQPSATAPMTRWFDMILLGRKPRKMLEYS